MSIRAARPMTVAVALAMLVPRSALAVESPHEDRATTHAVAIASVTPRRDAVRCSGTLVSSRVVLTARHCVAPVVSRGVGPCDATFGEPEAAERFFVNVSPWATEDTIWRRAEKITTPDSKGSCGDDVALLTLETPVPESEATPAVPILSEPAFLEAVRARVVGLSGHGASAANLVDVGVRRARFDLEVGCVPGHTEFACNGDLSLIDAREFTTRAGGCRGDSGAGAIAMGSRGVVLGVLSRAVPGLETESCGLGVFERTDVWSWLIGREVLAAESAAPAWVKALFPERAAIGEMCTSDASCDPSAACASTDGRRSWRCRARCETGATCGGGTCELGVCVDRPQAVDSSGPRAGCSVARTPEPIGALCMYVAACLALSVRRGRWGRACAAGAPRRSR